MKKLFIIIPLAALFTACAGDIPGDGPVPATGPDVEETSLAGAEKALESLNEFIGNLNSDPQTRATGTPETPKITLSRRTTASAYGGDAARTRTTGGESLPLYEFTLENPDNTVGFAVVGDASVLDQVIAYAPVGSMSDTVYNKALALYFRELAMLDKAIAEQQQATATRFDTNIIQEGWEDVASEYIGNWEFVGMYDGEYYRQHVRPSNAVGDCWYNYIHSLQTSTAPMGTRWGQLNPYSNDTPYIYNGTDPLYKQYRNIDHVKVGCFAVALGEVMNYHRHPARYNWNLLNQVAQIPPTPYRYSGSKNLGIDESRETPAQKEISKLLYDIGRGRTQYKASSMSSGTQIYEIKPTLNAFGYDVTEVNYGSAGGIAPIIKADIANNHSPVICFGGTTEDTYSDKYVGHFWVVNSVQVWSHLYFRGLGIVGGEDHGKVRVERITRRGYMMYCRWGWDADADGWYYSFQPFNSEHGQAYSLNYLKRIYMGIKPR